MADTTLSWPTIDESEADELFATVFENWDDESDSDEEDNKRTSRFDTERTSMPFNLPPLHVDARNILDGKNKRSVSHHKRDQDDAAPKQKQPLWEIPLPNTSKEYQGAPVGLTEALANLQGRANAWVKEKPHGSVQVVEGNVIHTSVPAHAAGYAPPHQGAAIGPNASDQQEILNSQIQEAKQTYLVDMWKKKNINTMVKNPRKEKTSPGNEALKEIRWPKTVNDNSGAEEKSGNTENENYVATDASNATIEEKFEIPFKMAGVVIGRGGESIREIMYESGAFIKLDKSITTRKIFTIKGDPMQVYNAKVLIEKAAKMTDVYIPKPGDPLPTLVEWKPMPTCWFFNFTVEQCDKSSSECKKEHQCCVCGDTGHGRMTCPAIGPYQETQTKTVEYSDSFVTGISPTMRDNELLEYENYVATDASNATNEEKFEIPFKMAGVVIGKGGESIRKIMTESGAFIKLDNSSTTRKIFTIRGDPMQIYNAKVLIEKAAQMTDVYIPKPGDPFPTLVEWKQMNTCWFFNFTVVQCGKSSSVCKKEHQCCVCGDTGHGRMTCPAIGSYQQTQTKTVECSDLFVTGISPTMRDNELLEYFTLFGKVYNFQIQRDNVTGQSKVITLKFFELADQERVLAHQHVVNGHMLTVNLCSNLNRNYIQQSSFQNPVAGLDPTMAFNQYLAPPSSNYSPQKTQLPGGMPYGSYTGDGYSNYNQIAMGSPQLPHVDYAPYQGVTIEPNASTTSYQMPQANNNSLNQTYSSHAVTTGATSTTAREDNSIEQAQLKKVEKLLKKMDEQSINDSSRSHLLKKVENILKKLDKQSNTDVERSSRLYSISRSRSTSLSTSYSGTSRSRSRSRERRKKIKRSRSKSNRRSRSQSPSRGRRGSRNRRRSRSGSQKKSYRNRSRSHSESRGYRNKVRSLHQRRQVYSRSKSRDRKDFRQMDKSRDRKDFRQMDKSRDKKDFRQMDKSRDRKDFRQMDKGPRSRINVTTPPPPPSQSSLSKERKSFGMTEMVWEDFWEGL